MHTALTVLQPVLSNVMDSGIAIFSFSIRPVVWHLSLNLNSAWFCWNIGLMTSWPWSTNIYGFPFAWLDSTNSVSSFLGGRQNGTFCRAIQHAVLIPFSILEARATWKHLPCFPFANGNGSNGKAGYRVCRGVLQNWVLATGLHHYYTEVVSGTVSGAMSPQQWFTGLLFKLQGCEIWTCALFSL